MTQKSYFEKGFFQPRVKDRPDQGTLQRNGFNFVMAGIICGVLFGSPTFRVSEDSGLVHAPTGKPPSSAFNLQEAMQRQWTSALQVLRERGENPEEMIQKAAAVLNSWTAGPREDYPEVEPDDEV